MDETWIHHFTPESNRQSTEWTAAGKSRLKQPKMQISAGMVVPFVFWDAQGILFIDYLEKRRTINSEYYIALLVHLKEEIAKKQTQEKSALSPRQCTVSQVQLQRWQNYMNCTSNCFLFSRSGPQWLLAVYRPQKNAPGKEI